MIASGPTPTSERYCLYIDISSIPTLMNYMFHHRRCAAPDSIQSQSGWNPNPQTFQPLEKAQRCEHVPHVQLSTLTIYLFGLSTLHLGIYNYLHPRNALTSLDLPLSSLHSINATSTATIAMGLYYTLAAYQWNSVFYMLTALMRLLTTSVFWTHAQPGVSRRGWKAGVDVGVQSWAG